MVRREHLHILDVVSVLLFSLLANFILPLRISFHDHVEWGTVARLTLLTISSISFYLTVNELKSTARYAEDEFLAEHSVERRAARSIDDRYREYAQPRLPRIRAGFIIALVSLITFFLEPALFGG